MNRKKKFGFTWISRIYFEGDVYWIKICKLHAFCKQFFSPFPQKFIPSDQSIKPCKKQAYHWKKLDLISYWISKKWYISQFKPNHHPVPEPSVFFFSLVLCCKDIIPKGVKAVFSWDIVVNPFSLGSGKRHIRHWENKEN